MSDYPIIFSAPMVQALLAGRKTMTRRLAWRNGPAIEGGVVRVQEAKPSPWQKVKPGDRLWVRESFCRRSELPISTVQKPFYMATDGTGDISKPAGWPWKPSIHMPRWASRLTLIVTATKIERLQDISKEDAIAEGIERVKLGPFGWRDYEWIDQPEPGTGAVASFMTLWDSIHGPDGWTSNPEVVALTFRVVRENIDRIKEAA
jgi:hypothetical protein